LRAVLLSDEKFVNFAKDKLVLSWENVREPVNIEFEGERRTLGGNTVMYLVSPEGTVADAFPGVYLPEDVLPSLEAAAISAMTTHEAQQKYHRQRSEGAIRARVNVSKAFVESPMLDAQGVGDRFELSTEQGVIDLSHVASSAEATRERLGLRKNANVQDAFAEAVRIDSQTNMLALRPLVHNFLLGSPRTPAEIRDVMFKDFLGVKIDDPTLGIR
jgi:hypothetical protein